jgi:PBP1b-binding outer membrane lipoprotein LpoB
MAMRTRLGTSGTLVSGVLVFLSGCSSILPQRTSNPAPTDVVATVGSTSVTLAEVDRTAMQMPVANFENLRLSQALYQARRAALDAIVDDLLIDQEAKARGLAATALVSGGAILLHDTSKQSTNRAVQGSRGKSDVGSSRPVQRDADSRTAIPRC